MQTSNQREAVGTLSITAVAFLSSAFPFYFDNHFLRYQDILRGGECSIEASGAKVERITDEAFMNAIRSPGSGGSAERCIVGGSFDRPSLC